MERPEALQFILVNSAVLPFANCELAIDLSRERFHPLRKCFGTNDFGQEIAFLSILFCRALLAIATLTAACGESTGARCNTVIDFVSSPSR